MIGFVRRIVARIRYRHFESELDREVAAHRAMLEDDARAGGLSEEDARHQAARRLGNATLARETARGVWIAPWLEGLWQDGRYALRGLRANPAFTIPALAVLIVTMGPATALYATVERILLRPWPVSGVDRVVTANTERPLFGGTAVATSLSEYRYLQERVRSLDLIAFGRSLLDEPDGTGASSVLLVSGNYFDVLRLPIAAGRGLEPADDTTGEVSAVAVISHGLWQRRFGGAPDVVGSVLSTRGMPTTIVGVAAPGAYQAEAAVAWVPLGAGAVLERDNPSLRMLPDGSGREVRVRIAGRLAPGATRRTADAELEVLAERFAAEHDVTRTEMSVRGTAFWNDLLAGQLVRLYSLLSLASLLTLLLGCANVGNLQLARGLSRRSELAVRLALGASRARLTRQFLLEGLLLSAAAAAVSLLVAYQLPGLVARLTPFAFGGQRITVEPQTMWFAGGLAVATCVVAGLLPALRVTRIATSSRRVETSSRRLRSGLLGAQVALSLVVLIGTALLVRGVQHAGGAGLGFDLHGAVGIWTGPPETYSIEDRRRLAEDVATAARRLGVAPVAVARYVPFTGGYTPTSGVRRSEADALLGEWSIPHSASAEYFGMLGIPLVAGRLFDGASPPHDVVVNQQLARMLWPGQPAVGQVFLDGAEELHVIGVVGDARTENFAWQDPAYYRNAGRLNYVLVPNDPAAIETVRSIVASIEPAAVPDVVAFTTGLREQLEPSTAGTRLAVAVGLLALFLACTGTLGVVSYVVSERTREIGVRMALGARAHDIVRTIVARVSWPLAAGLGVGLLGAQALGGLLGNRLYGLDPRDPIAYAVVLAVLAAAAVVAAWIPARRALRVNPAVTLRAE